MPAWFPPCATSILLRSISVAGWRPITGLASAVRNFDFAPLHLSRGLAPYYRPSFRRAQLRFRFASSQSRAGALCLPGFLRAQLRFRSASSQSRAGALWKKGREPRRRMQALFCGVLFPFSARLVAITKALIFLCITDSMFL